MTRRRGDSLRRQDVHRRCGYQGVRQAPPAAIAGGDVRRDRGVSEAGYRRAARDGAGGWVRDRKSVGEGKRVSVSVVLGGRRNIKNKTTQEDTEQNHVQQHQSEKITRR